MSLPSQEVLDDIKELITEITGFQDGDENFTICERYCLSHVVHHMYPFVSKSTVKNLVNSYVSRFYGHGYFKVSQELNYQVKRFLSNEKLFEKNPQYDIQWSLLSLLCSLSSNLTTLKKVPDLLPIDDDESVVEEINWLEYLTKDLPKPYPNIISSDSEHQDESGDECSEKSYGEADTSNKISQPNDKTVVIFDNRKLFNNENASELRKKHFEEFLKQRRSATDIENDLLLRGNISEKFDVLMSQEGITRKSQLLSEFELMENILYQFQTGERILLHKGLVSPALVSLTQDTLSNFLESLQPYFKIIRSFKDFDTEVTEAKYPEKCRIRSFKFPKGSQFPSTFSMNRRKISNVLYVYNVMLRKALEPFQNQVTQIVENLENYTLIQMERKLQPFFFDLTSLFYVHNLATKNWKKDSNWMISVRILSVLHNAITDATTSKMSFLYLNLFLHCFQVYLDIFDNWVSYVDLMDPNDEFIVEKSEGADNSKNICSEFRIRSYKSELEILDVKNVLILDFIGEKMIHVGQSLEVLRLLNRFVVHEKVSSQSSYRCLLHEINEKIISLGSVSQVKKKPQPQIKKRSIFTMKNSALLLERDTGGGDTSIIGSLLEELKEEEEEEKKKEKEKVVVEATESQCYSTCKDFIYSTIGNSFFKLAFDNVGIKQVQNMLEKSKMKEGEEDEALMVVKNKNEGRSAVYPFHKIISEAFHLIFDNRVSHACALVKHIVLIECDLISHLSLLRSVLLLNDAYLIQPFIMAFFTQPAVWGNPYSLTLHLKECVKGVYESLAHGLAVGVAKDSMMKCETVLNAIDSITIKYEVTWPLTLIFTPEVMEKYNQIFKLALKLKWAHWALSGLHFPGIYENQSGASNSTRHRLQLLRFWFLSALGRINNYFMAQMLPWNLDLNSCKDFKEIIQVHLDFIEKVHHNCLLGEKSPEGRNLIFQTLIPLCYDLWIEGSVMEKEKLSAVEKVFEKCQLQLCGLMAFLEKD